MNQRQLQLKFHYIKNSKTMFGMNYLTNRLLSTRQYTAKYIKSGGLRGASSQQRNNNKNNKKPNKLSLYTNSQSRESRRNQNKFDKNTYKIDRTEQNAIAAAGCLLFIYIQQYFSIYTSREGLWLSALCIIECQTNCESERIDKNKEYAENVS